MPITSSRQGPDERPDLTEALAVNEEMARILAEKRKRRGVARGASREPSTLESFDDEAAVAGVYAKWNGPREPQADE